MSAPARGNVCPTCDLDFSSVRAFDFHRQGKHAYLYAEGLRMQPPRFDGRRCLDEKELLELGWTVNRHGRWTPPRPQDSASDVHRRRMEATRDAGRVK